MPYLFDRAKPFYPIVVSYLINLHAIKEIAAIGVLGSNRSWNLEIGDGSPEDRKTLQASVQKLLGPLDMSVTDDADRLTISVDFVAKEFVENHSYLFEYQVRAALNALVMAHEVTKEKPYRDTGTKWEFLRHCRNAAAHDGRFYFKKGEPRFPARWRSTEIVATMHGEPLLAQPDGKGHLKLGDPIALLWEIERDYPGIAS